MKLIISHILLILFSINTYQAQAQKKRIFVFDEFTQGTALMKNRSRIEGKFNYDAANKAMMYLEKGEMMVLTNPLDVDTVFIASRKFVPLKGVFVEKVTLKNGNVYINWMLKEQYQGKKGAYGQTTQANVETINTNYYQPGTEYKTQTADVYKQANNNEYWIYLNPQPVKFKDKKSLLKLFPEKKPQIEAYIKENNLDLKNAGDVIKVTDYCLGV